MGRWKDHRQTGRMVIDALPKGMVRKSQTIFVWDVSGRCESPRLVEMTGRPAADWIRRLRYITVRRGTATSLHVELVTPCRRCPACLKARSRMWAARAMHEIREAHRTWFCTYTLRPEAHYVMQCRAVAIADSRSIPVAELHGEDLLNRQSSEVAKELTLMLKRLRKKFGTNSMRYLLVREKHKSGLPHWHAFVHECGEAKITHRALTEEWEWGFSKVKLVEEGDPRAAFYVAKYLGKSNEARVRASLGYGRFVGGKAQLFRSETARSTPSGTAPPAGRARDDVGSERSEAHPKIVTKNGSEVQQA